MPGLDPDARYSSRLSARSALYTELHQLLDIGADALPSADYRSRVIEQNSLAKPSASARAKLWKELKARYRLDADDPLFAAFLAEWKRCGSEAERSLTAYILFALHDRLVADLGTEWLRLWSLSKIARPSPSHHTASPSIVADAAASLATAALMRG